MSAYSVIAPEEYLQFYLLGTPFIRYGDMLINIPRRQVRCLLYFLSVRAEPVSLALLRFLFWPNLDDKASRRCLTHLISHARQSLPIPGALVTTCTHIDLERSKCWSDTQIFQQLKHIHQISSQDDLQFFRSAVGLYRGPLLEGLEPTQCIELDEEIESERRHLERTYLNSLHCLIDWETTQGHYLPALEYVYRYLAVDELCEEIYHHAILLYGLMGNREKVIELYKCCEQMLADELMLTPSDETQMLFRDALEGRIHKNYLARLAELPLRVKTCQTLFVGRKQELMRLVRLIESVPQSGGGLALICGELGIGKSRLLEEAMRHAQYTALALWANCQPGSKCIPLQPITQILHLLEHLAPGLQKPYKEQLEALLTRPTQRSAPQNTQPGWSLAEISKGDYFCQISQFLFELAGNLKPLILCIEDLNWADAETLEFLSYIAPQLHNKNILIIATFCCCSSTAMEQIIDYVQIQDAFQDMIELGGLNRQAASSLVRHYLDGWKITEEEITRLLELSGGNTLFLIEILDLVRYSPVPLSKFLDRELVTLPNSIKRAINLRTNQLEFAERQTLRMASTLAEPFGFEDIHSISNLPATQLLEILDELGRRHFLIRNGRSYYFSHTLIRHYFNNSLEAVLCTASDERAG